MSGVGVAWFGYRTRVRLLRDFPMPGRQGEPLRLFYRLTYYFIFPFYVFLTRDGYLLGNGSDLYLLPEGDIKRWQASGHLPNPLPIYKMTFKDRCPVWCSWGILILVGIVMSILKS